MKRIALYLSVIVAVILGMSSCQKEGISKGTDPAVVTPGPDVDITVSDVTDNSFKVTIAPKAPALYYSYLVAEGKAQPLDSVNLYQVKYSGLAQGTVKYSDEESVEITVDAEPNSVYTVYAVAGSVELFYDKDGNPVDPTWQQQVVAARTHGAAGIPGKVATKTVATSDHEAPAIVDFDFDGNQVAILFSEDVEYVEGSEIYGPILYKAYLTGAAYQAKTVASAVEVDGNVAVITFDEVTKPGAYYTVNFAEGTFVDAVGNPCAALESKFTTAYDFATDEFEYEGVYGCLENAPLTYKLPQVPTTVLLSDYPTTKFTIGVPEGVALINVVKDPYMTTIARTTASGSTVKEEVEMKPGVNMAGNWYDFWVKPAGEPQDGDNVTITIPKGAVRDWWGNVNDAAIVLGPFDVLNPLEATVTFTDVTVNSFTYDVTVSDKTGKQYWIADISKKEEALDDATLVKAYVDDITDWAKEDGLSFEEEMAEYYAWQGSQKDLLKKGLDANTEYEVSVFFLTATGELNSEVFRFDVTTLEDLETWKPLGNAQFTENLVGPVFGGPAATYAVPIEESESQAGRYRLVTPYGESFLYNEPGDYDGNVHYMVINAQDPQLVTVEESSTGCNWGYGEFVVISTGAYYMNKGFTPEEIIAGAGDVFGKLDNGVISFPDGGMIVTFGSNGPFQGTVKIVLPGAATTSVSAAPASAGQKISKKNFVLKSSANPVRAKGRVRIK